MKLKPREKLLLLGMCTFAWVGLFMTGPENPDDKYGPFAIGMFAAGLVWAFVYAIHCWSQYIQERDADKLKELLKRRDNRPNR